MASRSVVYALGALPGDPPGASPIRVVPGLSAIAGDILKVASGGSGTLVLTRGGEVYMWTGRVDDSLTPFNVEDFEGNRLVDVAAGVGHFLALTEDGCVYTWGSASCGQLGLGGLHEVASPTLLKSFAKDHRAIMVAAGSHHSMVLTDRGYVYAFGRNLEGQLGLGCRELQNGPHLVKTLFGTRIRSIACGYNYSVFLTDGGRVFACGEGATGALGLGNTTTQDTPRLAHLSSSGDQTAQDLQQRLTEEALRRVAGGGGKGGSPEEKSDRTQRTDDGCEVPAAGAALGWGHLLLLDNHGSVYSCGMNTKGQLGYGIPNTKQRSACPVRLQHVVPTSSEGGCVAERGDTMLTDSDSDLQSTLDELVALANPTVAPGVGDTVVATPLLEDPGTITPASLDAQGAVVAQLPTVEPQSPMPSPGPDPGGVVAGPASPVVEKVVACGQWSAAISNGQLYVWGSFGAVEFSKQHTWFNPYLPEGTQVSAVWPLCGALGALVIEPEAAGGDVSPTLSS